MARLRSGSRWAARLLLFALLFTSCSVQRTPEIQVVERKVTQLVEVTRVVEVSQSVFETQPIEVTPVPGSYPVSMLAGQWIEYWGVGDDLDLGYNDVYDIQVSEAGEISVTCPDQPSYIFEPPQYDGENLGLTLNVTGRGYMIDYKMHFDESGTLMIGTAQTNHGVLARVVWAKVMEPQE